MIKGVVYDKRRGCLQIQRLHISSLQEYTLSENLVKNVVEKYQTAFWIWLLPKIIEVKIDPRSSKLSIKFSLFYLFILFQG